jgi:plastocyanin
MRTLRLSTVALLTVFLLTLGLATTAVAKPSTTPRTYTVLVGAESAKRGVDVMSYFPASVTIRVGDSVRWVQNSNEIHTVTFLGGAALPDFVVPAASISLPASPSPLVFNPLATTPVSPSGGLGDTTTWANSGLMGTEPGQVRSFRLAFTAAGTYHYICIVHGMMMQGTITVVGTGTHVMNPGQVRALGQAQIAREMAKAPAVIRAAKRHIKPAVKNVDGTMTRFISMGFSKGKIDLMHFFPSKLHVRAGDKVVWTMSPTNDAPHTVTFLNGQPEPALVVPVKQLSGPPVFYINPGTLFPSQPTADLTRSGLYSSGLMNPIPGSTFTEVIGSVTPGPLRYLCLLHDTSGMKGTLVVLP